jgi:hypothetical protein
MDNQKLQQKIKLQQKVNEMELWALDKFCDYQSISVSDYINSDVMGEERYAEYLHDYRQLYGYCFECQMSECDSECPYQISKEQNNEQ